MSQKKTIFFAITLFLAGVSLACRLGEFVSESSTPTSSPTVRVARFATLTPTPHVVALVSVTPLGLATPTPMPSPTPSATPSPSATPTQSQNSPIATPSPTEQSANVSDQVAPSATAANPPTATPPPLPTAPPTPAAPPPLSGRIAFPIDDGLGQYDIWMVELPKGEPFLVLRRARQPNFSNSGQLLVNNENSPNGENLGLLDASNTWLGLVSDAPEDRHPFWSPEGDRYVFVNPRLLTDPLTQEYLTHLFIPCSTRRPLEENSESCKDTGGKSKLVPGDYPVWTSDYRIAYVNHQKGQEGIYLVSVGAIPREHASDPEPQRLVTGSDARPSDAQGNQLFFTAASLAQNWEAHAINLDGTNLLNLSNSPDSQDGLPAVSPDGAWVAFVSDRAEHWGIWVVPIAGGTPQEVVNLSKINTNPSPWGKEDRDWTNERITWGP
ncbi:MAG: hypothetical protein Fur0044_28480 [Anaerolineae bacterium]